VEIGMPVEMVSRKIRSDKDENTKINTAQSYAMVGL
jgi:uncharacterized OB-fold protein